ncbi:PREDICTED: uncharacterized protein LOC105619296 [Atta cephalotes]|uniref:Uncharacterized protein n=1 Tax=Atta cephalotes TaxID=12957 RepID=A0A158NFA4_ATTCE|nr:PREDICTED: uncharacterized protein LOC105619296 [Atta cephalotes]
MSIVEWASDCPLSYGASLSRARNRRPHGASRAHNARRDAPTERELTAIARRSLSEGKREENHLHLRSRRSRLLRFYATLLLLVALARDRPATNGADAHRTPHVALLQTDPLFVTILLDLLSHLMSRDSDGSESEK